MQIERMYSEFLDSKRDEYKEKSIRWVENKHSIESVGKVLYKNYEKLLNE